MPVVGGQLVSGPPLPCGECRERFTPSVVHGAARKGGAGLCPRCIKRKKAEKKAKKKK